MQLQRETVTFASTIHGGQKLEILVKMWNSHLLNLVFVRVKDAAALLECR